jgi:pantetheine-phosphate adenylyltransferase
MPASPVRRAVYGGSFDPPTLGHLFLIRQGARLFDRLLVAVGTNPAKHYTFPIAVRLAILRRCVQGLANVRVFRFEGRFLADFARARRARFLLRGIRNAQDYDFERALRLVNADIQPGLVSVFLMPPRELAELSSSFVKGLVGPRGWERVVRKYLPAPAFQEVRKWARQGPSRPPTPSGRGARPL